ncbi:Hsp70 family protein [Pseudonocardia sp. Cha107L01]|uniref:Hsp70 family protein n=1 Tax=Pseudonocardia sp. Cha107L01 TaxID=3457576 RepID=UPI00403E840A
MLVADIGSGDTELAVLTDGADRSRLLVATSRVEDLGGAVLDRALAAYVLEQLRGRFAGLDQADPANHAALRELVARCRLARADLARRPATVVDVRLPGGEERVRVIRTELESLIAGPISAAVSAIARMSGESEAKGIPIAALLLTGESARTPLLTEQLSARIRARVLVSPDAEWTAAVGAAGIAAARARRAQSGPPTVTRHRNAVPKTPPHPAPRRPQPQTAQPQKAQPQNAQAQTPRPRTPAPPPNYPSASRGTSRIRTAVASAVAGFAVLIAGGVAVSGAGGGSGAHLASGTHDGHR